MSDANGRGSGEAPGGALDSVRQLEQTLEERQEIQKLAEERRSAAHEEAGRIVAEARREGEATAAERRRQVLAEADAEAERILEEARANAAELRARAARDRDAAARAVVEWVLPGGEAGGEA